MTAYYSGMHMLSLSGEDVHALLPMARCIDLMAEALAALARGQATVPLRHVLWLPDQSGLLGMMPAYYGPASVMGTKVVSVMPGNHGSAYDAHQGSVLLFETNHGRPLAIADASAITAIRTAAVSGLATRLLARDDARDLAIMGSGTQARTHLEAMLVVRPLERVRVWSRTLEHAELFARQESERHEIPIEVVADAERAVTDASIICTTTSSREPVLRGDWIAAGAHVNAVGSTVKTSRELDGSAMQRAKLFVDRRESAINEAGDLLLAAAEGKVSAEHIVAELGDVLIGAAGGRRHADDITLFESLGLGVEDVAATWFAYTRALDEKRGTLLPLSPTQP
jgi:ornithine cyclodeaminase